MKSKINAKVSKKNKIVLFQKWCLGCWLADDTLSNSGGLVALQVVPQAVRSKSEDANDVEEGKDGDIGSEASKGFHSYKSAFQKLCLLFQPWHLEQEQQVKNEKNNI